MINPHQIVYRNLDVVGSWAFTGGHLVQYVRLLPGLLERFPLGDAVTTYPLEDHARAMRDVAKRIRHEGRARQQGSCEQRRSLAAIRTWGGERFGGATSRSGTPQFAAPEQLLGERVDQRADLYSLGAVAYFALLGQPPFEGATPEAVLAKQTTESLPSIRLARADVTQDLEAALRQAVRSEPAERYQTAPAFREALDYATGGVLKRMLAMLRVS